MFGLGIGRYGKFMLRLSFTELGSRTTSLPLPSSPPLSQFVRNTTFFGKLTDTEIWKSMNSVSNAGKRRGRHKSKSTILNTNSYADIGIGKEKIIWPGLNVPVIAGATVQNIGKSSEDLELKGEDDKSKGMFKKRVRSKIHPLERGWTSRSICGKVMDATDDIDVEEHTKDQFKSVTIQAKYLSQMTSTFGKVKCVSATVVSGNKNGVLGMASAKAPDLFAAVKRAQKKSYKILNYYELINPHTVNHNFFYSFGATQLYVYKRSPGYGLVCHRVIAEICKLLGIKDIYAKIDGPTNAIYIARAFLLGLADQKSYQQLADDMGLHLVEMKKERNYFPVVLASPSLEIGSAEAKMKRLTSFNEYVMGGRLHLLKRRGKPKLTDSYLRHIKKTIHRRNHPEVKLQLLVKYGCLRSYLTDIYPECTHVKPKHMDE